MSVRGQRGNLCGGNAQEGRPAKGQGICHAFASRGRCRYGARCKYIHDKKPPTGSGVNSPEPANQGSSSEEDYRAWKRQLRRGPTSNNPQAAKEMWSKALGYLEKGTREHSQRLLRDLLSDEQFGLAHVKHVLEMRPNEDENAFIQCVRPFITLVVHPAWLDCLSLDTYVGDLYVFMSGSGGSRAIPFFQSLTRSILEGDIGTEALNDKVPDMLLAVREMLKRNPKAIFHEDLPTVIDDFEKVSKMDTLPTNHSVTVRIAEIQRMISRAKGILVATPEETEGLSPQTNFKSTYPREVPVPSDRHDNDKRDITKIKIIPTRGEILSEEPDFLPSLNKGEPHFLEGVERMLDTHFRLLRNDIFGDVRSILGDLLSRDQRLGVQNHKLEASVAEAGAHFYSSASVSRLGFTRKRGFEAIICFAQPRQVHSKPAVERQRWWEDTRRFEEGSLLCFVSLDENRPLIFLTVTERQADPKIHQSLTSGPRNSGIIVKLADGEDLDQIELLMAFSMRPPSPKNYLIEFPRVLLSTFLPVLENLQRMHKDSRLPFANWILPNWTGEVRDAEIQCPPPPYARSPRFAFDLKPILVDPSASLTFEPTSGHQETLETLTRLQKSTLLDEGQSKALINALTSEFALIQGPPGTGKSYLGVQLMRVLVANKKKAMLGPIVVVCYTNHALDQFLEQLIQVGIDKVIRIGGRSNSKILEGRNLRTIAINEGKSRQDSVMIGSNFGEIQKLENEFDSILKAATRSRSIRWDNIEQTIKKIFPRIHPQFSHVDKDGFKQARKRDPLERWRTGAGENIQNQPLGDIERILPAANVNIHSLAVADRRILLDYMVDKVRESYVEKLSGIVQEDINIRARTNKIHDEVDRRLLATADVIGVTTSGLAKRISVLQHVHAKVVICEEAGEVLEAHMLSTLIPSVEHLIQIGDHQQLRPQISNFKLSIESREGQKYGLDRSQFERLTMVTRSSGDQPFPVSQLNIQRRMRPQISTLIHSTLYTGLKNHEGVENLPHVVGMRKNVFWLDHTKHEDRGPAQLKSQSNSWEIEMVQGIVRHIVRQGVYSSQEIAVLTPYVGQLQKLRTAMRKDFEIVISERDEETLAKEGFDEDFALGPRRKATPKKFVEKKKMSDLLRIATVDNFQGEEAKVIIVSLVRSNNENRVGFLRTTNRINVLLSRAQHGMYLLGNSRTYSKIPMWAQVIDMLRKEESIGKVLALCCPRHPETELLVTKPEDFAKLSPEGGCNEPCNRRFGICGHRCHAKCHSDSMHQTFKCPNPCERIFNACGHKCPKDCGDPCGPCETKIDKVCLPCDHYINQVPCHMIQNVPEMKCTMKVRKRVPGCGHILTIPCYQDVESTAFKCPVQCAALLECGHPCPGTCGTCNIEASTSQPRVMKHGECPKICGRRYGSCHHTCERACHGNKDCGLCPKPCEVRCSHSTCGQKCHEGCTPCIERCVWACEHQGQCSMPCSAPCDRLPCSERCQKVLPCGHQCPSLCAETCPTEYCHTCSKKQDQRVDMIELKTYGEIDVNITPIVVLTCGHFFTAETLDGHVGMSEVYEQNNDGEYSGLRAVPAISNHPIPRCPDCQCPIQQFATQRYNRVINRAFMNEASKRFLVKGQTNVQNLEKEIDALEAELEQLVQMTNASDLSHIQILQDMISSKCSQMEKVVLELIDIVGDKYQPVRKLHDATIKAICAKRSLEDNMQLLATEQGEEILGCDRRVVVGGQMLRIRVHQIYLQAILSVSRTLDPEINARQSRLITGASNFTATRAFVFFKKCEEIIQVCSDEQFPKNGVEARLYYGRVVMCFRLNKYTCSLLRANGMDPFERARELLGEAKELCDIPFKNAEILKVAVQETLRVISHDRYETVTDQEMRAIKEAMVSGSEGMATHSGHWYNCENGHPFAVGECGMPMEQARCPECGAAVGGENHAPAQGVTRAIDMERGEEVSR